MRCPSCGADALVVNDQQSGLVCRSCGTFFEHQTEVQETEEVAFSQRAFRHAVQAAPTPLQPSSGDRESRDESVEENRVRSFRTLCVVQSVLMLQARVLAKLLYHSRHGAPNRDTVTGTRRRTAAVTHTRTPSLPPSTACPCQPFSRHFVSVVGRIWLAYLMSWRRDSSWGEDANLSHVHVLSTRPTNHMQTLTNHSYPRKRRDTEGSKQRQTHTYDISGMLWRRDTQTDVDSSIPPTSSESHATGRDCWMLPRHTHRRNMQRIRPISHLKAGSVSMELTLVVLTAALLTMRMSCGGNAGDLREGLLSWMIGPRVVRCADHEFARDLGVCTCELRSHTHALSLQLPYYRLRSHPQYYPLLRKIMTNIAGCSPKEAKTYLHEFLPPHWLSKAPKLDLSPQNTRALFRGVPSLWALRTGGVLLLQTICDPPKGQCIRQSVGLSRHGLLREVLVRALCMPYGMVRAVDGLLTWMVDNKVMRGVHRPCDVCGGMCTDTLMSVCVGIVMAVMLVRGWRGCPYGKPLNHIFQGLPALTHTQNTESCALDTAGNTDTFTAIANTQTTSYAYSSDTSKSFLQCRFHGKKRKADVRGRRGGWIVNGDGDHAACVALTQRQTNPLPRPHSTFDPSQIAFQPSSVSPSHRPTSAAARKYAQQWSHHVRMRRSVFDAMLAAFRGANSTIDEDTGRVKALFHAKKGSLIQCVCQCVPCASASFVSHSHSHVHAHANTRSGTQASAPPQNRTLTENANASRGVCVVSALLAVGALRRFSRLEDKRRSILDNREGATGNGTDDVGKQNTGDAGENVTQGDGSSSDGGGGDGSASDTFGDIDWEWWDLEVYGGIQGMSVGWCVSNGTLGLHSSTKQAETSEQKDSDASKDTSSLNESTCVCVVCALSSWYTVRQLTHHSPTESHTHQSLDDTGGENDALQVHSGLLRSVLEWRASQPEKHKDKHTASTTSNDDLADEGIPSDSQRPTMASGSQRDSNISSDHGWAYGASPSLSQVFSPSQGSMLASDEKSEQRLAGYLYAHAPNGLLGSKSCGGDGMGQGAKYSRAARRTARQWRTSVPQFLRGTADRLCDDVLTGDASSQDKSSRDDRHADQDIVPGAAAQDAGNACLADTFLFLMDFLHLRPQQTVSVDVLWRCVTLELKALSRSPSSPHSGEHRSVTPFPTRPSARLPSHSLCFPSLRMGNAIVENCFHAAETEIELWQSLMTCIRAQVKHVSVPEDRVHSPVLLCFLCLLCARVVFGRVTAWKGIYSSVAQTTQAYASWLHKNSTLIPSHLPRPKKYGGVQKRWTYDGDMQELYLLRMLMTGIR